MQGFMIRRMRQGQQQRNTENRRKLALVEEDAADAETFRSGRSGSTSGTSSDEDLGPESGPIKWNLELGNSVYDEALMLPLLKAQTAGRCGYFFGLLVSVLLLAINGTLQFLVLGKVAELTEDHNAQTSDKLFSLCLQRNASMPFKRALEQQPEDGKYYDCGPLLPTMLSIPSAVDADKDGMWSLADAEKLKPIWGERYHKDANNILVWRHYIEKAEERKMVAQAGLSQADTIRLTKNFTQIPVTWMAKERPYIELCIMSDPYLCGNLEERGALQHYFPNPKLSANRRISMCKDIVNNYCVEAFGQLYLVYMDWSYELCGDRNSLWFEDRRVIAASYAKANKYTVVADAITSPLYATFLLIILGIWWMSMLIELRELAAWWVMLIFYPTRNIHNDTLVHNDTKPLVIHEGRVQIKAIPMPYKIGTAVFNLLPRTVLAIWLSYVGSVFLICADDYGELILNSVALAFLIEIDNMLFAAVVSDQVKEILADCHPLELSFDVHYCLLDCLKTVTTTGIYTIFIIAVTLAMITQAYYSPGGKFDMGEALRCLCHASGERCISAQILGGQPYLREIGVGAYAHDIS